MESISSVKALAARRKYVNPNSGAPRWRTPFLGAGTEVEAEVRNAPLGFLIEMTPDSVLPTHFHPVNQFQVFVSGSGTLAKHGAAPLSIHYADRHTAYGPITAGPHGIAYFTLRAHDDARAMFLHNPGARELLKPSKHRFHLIENIVLAVPPVLTELDSPIVENLLEQKDGGPAAFMLRLGGGQTMLGPDPAPSSGQFYLVVSGSLLENQNELPLWSLLFVGHDEAAPTLRAGKEGSEILVLQFPSD
jgi:hypothetical protein